MKTKLGKSAVYWGVWGLLWLCSTAGYAQNQLGNTGGRCDTIRFVSFRDRGGSFHFKGTKGAVFYVESDGQKTEYRGADKFLYYSFSEDDTAFLFSASPDGRLTWLDCSETDLMSLDVSGCTALKLLDCDNSQLRSLNVSGCTALKTLDGSVKVSVLRQSTGGND